MAVSNTMILKQTLSIPFDQNQLFNYIPTSQRMTQRFLNNIFFVSVQRVISVHQKKAGAFQKCCKSGFQLSVIHEAQQHNSSTVLAARPVPVILMRLNNPITNTMNIMWLVAFRKRWEQQYDV